MKIKHWDPELEEWIIDGASNASNIELSNPAFVDKDEEGNIKTISTDQGFTKIHNKVSKLEDNLAWIYINGAHGGGGGPGGPGGELITINTRNINTIYTSTGNIKLEFAIETTTSRTFTITFRDQKSGALVHETIKRRSMEWHTVEIKGLTEDTSIEIRAEDTSANMAMPKLIKVIFGSISLSLFNPPKNTLTIGAIDPHKVDFTLINKIEGAKSTFVFNVTSGKEEQNIETVIDKAGKSLNFSYELRNIIYNKNLFPNNPEAGQKFTFEAYALTRLDGVEIRSTTITFNVTIIESNKLSILFENIGETNDVPIDFPKGAQINFRYYLSYIGDYSSFVIVYDVFKKTYGSGEEVRVLPQNYTNAEKGKWNIITIGTTEIPVTAANEYLIIRINAHATNNASDIRGQVSADVYATLSEPDKIDLTANNKDESLLVYFSKLTDFPGNTKSVWSYDLNNTAYPYTQPFKGLFSGQDFKIDLRLHKTNGDTTGFINTGNNANPIPGIALGGESYATLEMAEQMFPDRAINEGFSLFQEAGFNISFTYKTTSTSNDVGVIMSMAKYDYNGEMTTGIQINTNNLYIKIGASEILEVQLPINELTTIDLDVSTLIGWKAEEGEEQSTAKRPWYFKVFVNGVLSSVRRLNEESIDWKFSQDLYFGCKNNNGVLSDFSSLNIYDLKIYTKSQINYTIVQNYISATEQASLVGGVVDETLDIELRSKNMFNSEGKCLICDDDGVLLKGQELFNVLEVNMTNPEISTPYPLIFVKEISSGTTDFKNHSRAIFDADSKDDVMGPEHRYPCSVRYINKLGVESIIQTQPNVAPERGVRIGIQGTSSLSYNSKNYQLYLGDMDGSASPKQHLFLVNDDWLPENEFTLKADVMDSAHVNNVSIGRIINGRATNDKGDPINPLTSTPPMRLSTEYFPQKGKTFVPGVDEEHAKKMRSRIRHTSDGFPCLLFIEYARDKDDHSSSVEFLGMYNFNLGRSSAFNLGLKVLQNYTLENDINTGEPKTKAPASVVDYNELTRLWDGTTVDNGNMGVHSVEINQNDSSNGAFQQDDISIVKFMADIVYSSMQDNASYEQLQKFYEYTANAVLEGVEIPRTKMDTELTTPTIPAEGDDYTFNLNAKYNFNLTDRKMNWENAVAYYVLIIVFGLVDSVTKNVTLRSWGNGVWFPSFYDMDTAFGLTNAGQDIVQYWAHLHRYTNTNAEDSGLSKPLQIKNYPHSNSENITQYYASYWNRIWEIVENLPTVNKGELYDRDTISKVYVKLRTILFPNPKKFIEDHYKSYTDQTGAIIFNYDYQLKYVDLAYELDGDGKLVESTDYSQLQFLHGNRVIHVKDWFEKRIFFLDSLYGLGEDEIKLPIQSPTNNIWSNNKAPGISNQPNFPVVMKAPSKIIFRWSIDTSSGSFWVEDTDTNIVVSAPSGETIINMYAARYISKFTNFKDYKWSALKSIDFPLLEELDLSGMTMDSGSFMDKAYNAGTDIGLRSIKKLDLSGVILTLRGVPIAARSLDVTDCRYLSYLDVSNSNITEIKLSDTETVLKYYNLSNTRITNLELRNQSFLSDLILDGCDDLIEIKITNCNSLRNLNLPKNVQKVSFINCELLSDLNITYSSSGGIISNLVDIKIENCPGLKSFNISGQNNPLLKVDIQGAINLEVLDLSNTASLDITLPTLYQGINPNFYSLKSLDISNTEIKSLKFGLEETDHLNLMAFKDVQSIRASNNTALEIVKCINDENNPVNLGGQAFRGCINLKRVYGHLNLTGTEIFRGCGLFKLNDESIYDGGVTKDFLIGDSVTNITIKTNSLRSLFEECSSLTFNDFRKIIFEFNSGVTSIESTFKRCVGITGSIWRDIFSRSRNITNIKGAFSNCSIKGSIISRLDNFSSEDKLVNGEYIGNESWGMLDYIPNLLDTESAFEYSGIEWIDNNLFQPKVENGETTYYKIGNIKYMFRGCWDLKSCGNAREVKKDVENINTHLNSETFFINLRSLVSVYPESVFSGCFGVYMDIINDSEGNTLLYHALKHKNLGNIKKLTNSLYEGVNLVGEIKENVFGGITQELADYNLPSFNNINSPFSGTGSLIEVDVSKMEKIFWSIRETLLQAVGIFSGMKTIGSKVIPDKIFAGCVKLNSIESMFSGLDLDNDGEIYQFPNETIFKDTAELKSIKNLFSGSHDIRIELIGNGFTNCILEDVSGAFYNSGVFGLIPYNLFFMKKGNTLTKTIKKMNNVFGNCWLLGYSADRKIDVGTVLETNTYGEGDNMQVIVTYSTWNDNVISDPANEGTKMNYKLDHENMVKTYNYDRDDDIIIKNPAEQPMVPNPEYDAEDNPDVDKTILDPDYVAYFSNPKYNPGEYTYDTWYLDGRPWERVSPVVDEDYEDQRLRLFSKYFRYDEFQAEAIKNHSIGDPTKEEQPTEWYIDTQQNYAIPTDLFRYCHEECTLNEVLNSLTWYKRVFFKDDSTDRITVAMDTSIIEGLTGRMPAKLFDSLTTSESFIGVFNNTNFDPYYGLRGTPSNKIERGLMYPIGMFKWNISLKGVSELFSNTVIPVGVDINPDLFSTNTDLRNISRMWADTTFDSRDYAKGIETKYPQIDFSSIFANNARITDASGLFAVSDSTDQTKGIILIEDTLLRPSRLINNISRMFANNRRLTGSVPLFNSNYYTVINAYEGYLTGVSKGQVTNQSQLDERLRPIEWGQ